VAKCPWTWRFLRGQLIRHFLLSVSRIDASLCGALVFVFICDVDHVFKVKDGLKILHLRLANAQVEERKIKKQAVFWR